MVNCDKCNKDFKMKIKTRKYLRGVTEVYFKCPHCGERYTGYYTNDKIKKMQRELNDLNKKLISDPEDLALKIRFGNLKESLRLEMEDLKFKIVK